MQRSPHERGPRDGRIALRSRGKFGFGHECAPSSGELREAYPWNVEKISEQFWPPKPKLFDRVVLTFPSRSLFGT